MPYKAIFYDTETTGIKPDKDHIIEIAAFEPSTGRRFEKFVNPGCPIPREATAIHHITDEMVANAPSFLEVGQEFIEFCGSDIILIAHNNDAFDYKFLSCSFGRYSKTMPDHWKFLDTLKWARRYRPDLPRHTLQFLREIYNIPANNAHRAFDDVVVLHKVFDLMVGDLTIDAIYELLNQQKAIQHMPFGKYQGQPLKQVPSSYIQWLDSSGALSKPENSELRECFLRLGQVKNQLVPT